MKNILKYLSILFVSAVLVACGKAHELPEQMSCNYGEEAPASFEEGTAIFNFKYPQSAYLYLPTIKKAYSGFAQREKDGGWFFSRHKETSLDKETTKPAYGMSWLTIVKKEKDVYTVIYANAANDGVGHGLTILCIGKPSTAWYSNWF